MKLREHRSRQADNPAFEHAGEKEDQLSRTVSKQNAIRMYVPLFAEHFAQALGLALRVVLDSLNRPANRSPDSGRGTERIDAGTEISNVAPVPTLSGRNREDIAAMSHLRRLQ